MSNRVLVGKRGSDFGLFVSKSGVDVTDTTSTIPLSFDSRAAASLIVHTYGQGILLPLRGMTTFVYDGVTYTQTQVDITHGLNYHPAFMVRWCDGRKIGSSGASSGGYGDVAQQVDSGTYKLRLESNFDAPNASAVNGADNTVVAFYSYIVFKEPNFLNGESF